MSSSKYSDEGTLAHALAALCLTEHKDASAYVGRVIECEDYEHSPLGPSGAARWMRCPGSVSLIAKQPFEPRKFSGEVTDDMADAVQLYVDSARIYIAGGHHLLERRVDLSPWLGKDQGGHLDLAVITPDEIQAHDLKFGRGVEVFARENEQLQLYALGLLRIVELTDGIPADEMRVRIVIHQPRIKSGPDEWLTTVDALHAFGQKVRAAVELTKSMPTLYVPGDKQCKFCDAKPECPEIAKAVSKAVFDDFDVVGNPHETAQPKLVPAGPTALSAYMAKVDLVEGWCKAVRAKVEALLLQGAEVAGWKLVAGKKGARKWTDETAVEELLKKARLKQDIIYKSELKSPTQMEKALKPHPKHWAKLTGSFQTPGYITQADGGPSVASADDPRPVFTPGATADDFDAVVPVKGSELAE